MNIEVPSKYACPVCAKPYADLAAKKAHVRTEHPRPRVVKR